ncbi:uncharacterized protein LOC103704914 isoform X2 [Phoenix dactylifera]|uniref:Uncharacterized protein LOC103704914 isoform X2 n=1 Tax=Phoenix dactylifera TaxID=42345 RepID=A0A8B8J351_PHODC|nr:uncharacterized protein LOC103704914 isoform X2 [Phoenix dactylifera]
MSSAQLRLSDHCIPSPPVHRRGRYSPWSCCRVPIAARKLPAPRVRSDGGHDEAAHVGDRKELSAASVGNDGPGRSNGSKPPTKGFSSNELMQRLKRYGVAGILSYGLLNTIYYLTTFLLVWFYFAPAPGRMGYVAAVQRFLKVMAMVWAGSQVTKIVRAGGALALAPFVDRGLSWFTVKFKFESEGKAFAAIAGLCFGLALLLFFGLTLLWA